MKPRPTTAEAIAIFLGSARYQALFWARVAKGDECWDWIGFVTDRGYGRLDIDGRQVRVHRLSFALHNGFDPGLVRHSCDRPICVNPVHLLAGTQADNVADMDSRGRRGRGGGRKPGCESRRILTAEIVGVVKAELLLGRKRSDIAKERGVTVWTIHSIANGRIWPDVEARKEGVIYGV